MRTGPPPLEWISSPPLVAAVLITTKGDESPGSSRMGVKGALQSCEGTLGRYGTIPLKTIWSRLPYVMVVRWDFYGTIG